MRKTFTIDALWKAFLLVFIWFVTSCLNYSRLERDSNVTDQDNLFFVPPHESNPSKKVFAHYFTQFPRSIDNLPWESDYYQTEYLNVNGESGKHAAYGGYLRQRPEPREPLATADWELDDLVYEVRTAKRYGIDGFALNVLSINGYHYERVKKLFEATSASDVDFSIVLMPDMTALNTLAEVESLIEEFYYHPHVFRLSDGRMVLSPYFAERMTGSEWGDFLQKMEARGFTIAFFPVFHDWVSHASDFSHISYGFSDWGPRSPEYAAEFSNVPNLVHAYGVKWMQGIAPQDFRPKDACFSEGSNSLGFRTAWNSAIQGEADWVQLITWNDYSEGTEIAPSTRTGRSWLEIGAYYISWFKTGIAPKIVKNQIYVIQRNQFTHGTFDSDVQTVGRFQLREGSAKDDTEILAFVTGPSILKVTREGTEDTFTADNAGVYSWRIEVKPGPLKLELTVNGTTEVATTLPAHFTLNPVYQDLLYELYPLPQH